jgi:hypothetical protein
MSYGLFTVTREELADLRRLREKLTTVTGAPASAERLVGELRALAEADPAARSWRILPAAGEDGGKLWRAEVVETA